MSVKLQNRHCSFGQFVDQNPNKTRKELCAAYTDGPVTELGKSMLISECISLGVIKSVAVQGQRAHVICVTDEFSAWLREE